jgi:8-amino-7-oxononanoate synthase
MTSSSIFSQQWEQELENLKQRDLLRVMPAACGLPGRLIEIAGKRLINFSSNNYLGLAAHPRVIEAFGHYAATYGAGATASRLIAGNTEIHRELEEFIADWKGAESAVLFGSGYQANLGILSALTDSSDVIISDALNHASIIDGCRLSRSKIIVYPHFDLDRLEGILKLDGFRRKFVVTESVFSMDGDFAPLKGISLLCDKYGAALIVDEAHGGGVIGPQGRGLAAEVGVQPEIQMGTLGKAVGVTGAYVAGSKPLIDLLINKARSLVYTTASSPAATGAALAALKVVISEEGDRRRADLKRNVTHFSELISKVPNLHVPFPSHIAPVRIGESSKTLAVSAKCREGGVFAHPIRFPTVPEGTARIRFTLMSDHTMSDLEKAVAVLRSALEAEGRSEA